MVSAHPSNHIVGAYMLMLGRKTDRRQLKTDRPTDFSVGQSVLCFISHYTVCIYVYLHTFRMESHIRDVTKVSCPLCNWPAMTPRRYAQHVRYTHNISWPSDDVDELRDQYANTPPPRRIPIPSRAESSRGTLGREQTSEQTSPAEIHLSDDSMHALAKGIAVKFVASCEDVSIPAYIPMDFLAALPEDMVRRTVEERKLELWVTKMQPVGLRVLVVAEARRLLDARDRAETINALTATNDVTEIVGETVVAVLPSNTTSDVDTPSDDALMCNICVAEPQNCALIPCGHVTCYSCATRLQAECDKCPYCRVDIQRLVRIGIV